MKEENRDFIFNPETKEFTIKKLTKTEDYTAKAEDIYTEQGIIKTYKEFKEFLKAQKENFEIMKQKFEQDSNAYEKQIKFFTELTEEIEKNYNVKNTEENKEISGKTEVKD
jgi:hypothetical protein